MSRCIYAKGTQTCRTSMPRVESWCACCVLNELREMATAAKALVAKWRNNSTDDFVNFGHDPGERAYRACADQLEASLHKAATKAETPR